MDFVSVPVTMDEWGVGLKRGLEIGCVEGPGATRWQTAFRFEHQYAQIRAALPKGPRQEAICEAGPDENQMCIGVK